MINIPDPADIVATPETLRHQAKHGVIDGISLRRALMIIGHTPSWRDWVAFFNVGLLIIGTGFMVCGVIFFFAFNWQGMHRFVKLGLLEGSVVITLILAVWLGLDRLVGKVALTASALLIGATLAVYGQVYQTGADAYQLFLNWALIIAPWVFISRWAPLWGIWILLLNLTVMLYAEYATLESEWFFGAFFILNGLFFCMAEWAQKQPIPWLETRWIPRILAIPMLGALLFASIGFIVDVEDQTTLLGLLFLGFIGVAGSMGYWYSIRFFDAFMLIITGFAACICFDTWLFTSIDIDETGLLLAGLLIIGQTAGIVAWIRQRAAAWELKNHEA